MTEDNTHSFASSWTGTGTIENSGDAERIVLSAGEYMESEIVQTGVIQVELFQNEYDPTGDDVVLRYRQAATPNAVVLVSWLNYTIPFFSSGYVQVRLESTL